MSVIKDFGSFIKEGNVVDLAIAVVIGGAFGKIVSAAVSDLVMPLVNALVPQGDWRKWEVSRLHFRVGDFLGTVVDFLIVAFVVFIVMVKLVGVATRKNAPTAVPPATVHLAGMSGGGSGRGAALPRLHQRARGARWAQNLSDLIIRHQGESSKVRRPTRSRTAARRSPFAGTRDWAASGRHGGAHPVWVDVGVREFEVGLSIHRTGKDPQAAHRSPKLIECIHSSSRAEAQSDFILPMSIRTPDATRSWLRGGGGARRSVCLDELEVEVELPRLAVFRPLPLGVDRAPVGA